MKINRESIFHLIIQLLLTCGVIDAGTRYDDKLKAYVIEIPAKKPK